MSTSTDYGTPLSIAAPGGRRVIGVISGPKTAPLNVSSATLAREMTKLAARAHEVRNSALLPSEKAGRLAELRGPALQAAREHQRVLSSERERIQHLAATASPVRPLSQLPADALWVGQLLCQRLMQMSVSEKTQIVAKAMADPLGNAQWAAVLLQWPLEVTGVDAQMRERLRSAALQAMDPALAEAIDVQLEQLEFATRADELAQGILGETLPGAIQELRDEPPEPEKPAEPTAADFLAAVPAHVVADLLAGPGLSRPAGIELSRAQS